MSIDVSYYSFDPSRADKQWLHFIEDLTVLRKRYAPWLDHKKADQDHYDKRREIESIYEPFINEKRNNIFNYFNSRGYLIPWIEWDKNEGTDKQGYPIFMNAEDKIEYLRRSGCVYPRGADLKDKNVSYLMLYRDAPEYEAYERILEERYEAISKSSESTSIAPGEDNSIVLNERQKKLDRDIDFDYLKLENRFDYAQLIPDLKFLDIHYGSVSNDYFENPKVESIFLETIVGVSGLKNEVGIPTRDEWIRFYQNLDTQIIQKASNEIMKALNWDKDEADWQIRDYLRSVRPVVKDLKETPGSLFIRLYGGADAVEPKSAETLLIERANKRATEYKGLLPPVL